MATQQEFADFEVEGLDLSNTKPMEGGRYDLVGEGSYIAEVIGVSQDVSEGSNKPYIEVEFQISEGQETDEAIKFTGQHLWNRYYLTDKAKGRLVQLMKACGAQLDMFRAREIFGAKIRLDVVHNQGEQKTDDNGAPLPIKTFANVCKERPLDENAAAAPTPPTPPVAQNKGGPAKPTGGATKPAANGTQARRA